MCCFAQLCRYGSWALADFISTLLPLAKDLDITVPTWFPTDASGGASGGAPANVQSNYGDGGCLDNLNVASFLRRGVTSLVLFYTASQPLSPANK